MRALLTAAVLFCVGCGVAGPDEQPPMVGTTVQVLNEAMPPLVPVEPSAPVIIGEEVRVVEVTPNHDALDARIAAPPVEERFSAPVVLTLPKDPAAALGCPRCRP